LIDKAIELSSLQRGGRLLEIGCGPGTATVPLLERGFDLTCVEPSSGMLDVARVTCKGFENVKFHETAFSDYELTEVLFDAIVAATSFHWTIDEPSIHKVHRLLDKDRCFVLLWNLPPEPSRCIRDNVADALGCTKPFYFGDFSEAEHRSNIRTKVIDRIAASGLFHEFSHDEVTTKKNTNSDDYLAFVRTLSPYIRLEQKERQVFFGKAGDVLDEAGEFEITNTCILNVARRRNPA
jgi:SAM-dependent methyltransferase